ncbi:MAG TPA: MFS transporter [Chryseolinea sp.]|nr:MFS transporter [Chryseolinea sp.]
MVNVKIYSSQFWLLCTSSLLFFASFNMLIPELPQYLTSLGGADFKGLIISLFTLTAMLSRPFSGKLADKIGRVPVIMVGSIVCFACSLVYPLVSTVAGFLLLRLIHGFSTGFTPTGTAAYLSDVIPAERRGEAMGLFGTAGSLGMAGGPALGGSLANHFGLDAVFYCSSACGLMSVLILMGIKETLNEKHKYGIGLLKVNKQDLFEPRVLAPCLVMVLLGFSYGTSFTLIPDFGQYVGIRNNGLLFTYMTIASLIVRLVGGRASDRYGRQPVLLVCAFFILVSMLVIGFSQTELQLILGVTLYGLANGTSSPTLIAWATDLSDPKFRGRGVASVYIFMEFGIGIGAFLSGILYANDSGRFSLVFGICAALAGIAVLYLLFKRRVSQRVTA